MIFVTVGSQMPFNRLVRLVDHWAAEHRNSECFAQIGKGGWQPKHMKWTEMMSPELFRENLENSRLIVSHAGMGTILSALDIEKKIIVVPRIGRLRETRNDHQTATAKQLEKMGYVIYPKGEGQLIDILNNANEGKKIGQDKPTPPKKLINTLREFILDTN